MARGRVALDLALARGVAVRGGTARRPEYRAADGIERQLERSVFADDPDAIEALEARIAEREAEAERKTAINKAWRKTKGTAEERAAQLVAEGVISEQEKPEIVRTMTLCSWLKGPYFTTNTRARIRSDRQRLEEIKRRQQTTAKAEAAAGGVVIEGAADYVAVTFAEKPEREILDALRAAGFCWSRGSWCGYRDKVPQCVRELVEGAGQ